MSIHRKQRFISLAKALGIALLALTLAGIVYEQIGRRRDRNHYPQIGRSIDIGGRTLNIFCSGEGSPTVILDSGGHTAGYTWIGIQPEIAKLTRTCWYDRAGYGWSDPLPPPAPPRLSRMNCTHFYTPPRSRPHMCWWAQPLLPFTCASTTVSIRMKSRVPA